MNTQPQLTKSSLAAFKRACVVGRKVMLFADWCPHGIPRQIAKLQSNAVAFSQIEKAELSWLFLDGGGIRIDTDGRRWEITWPEKSPTKKLTYIFDEASQ